MIFLKLGSWLASQKADRNVQLHSRSPHGERGLKFAGTNAAVTFARRSPHGERGLKCRRSDRREPAHGSLSSRRAWIEIPIRSQKARAVETRRSPHGERGLKFAVSFPLTARARSLSSRRAWIEIGSINNTICCGLSLSSRRAWIEIECITRLLKYVVRSLSSRRAWIEI